MNPTTVNEPNETSQPSNANSRRLQRAREGRALGGVAAGLGRYFDIDPLIVRIGFAVTAFVGGIGILAYVVAWLTIPDETTERPHMSTATAARWPLYLFAALAAVTIADAAPYEGFGWHGYHSYSSYGSGITVLTLAAAAIAVAALVAQRWWRALIALGVVASVAIAAGGLLIADVPLRGGLGDRTWTPTHGVRASYQLLAGRGVLDLTALASGEHIVTTRATVGTGTLRVIVPADAWVDVHASAAAGRVKVFGRTDDGTDADERVLAGGGFGPVIRLEARTGFGTVEVVRDNA